MNATTNSNSNSSTSTSTSSNADNKTNEKQDTKQEQPKETKKRKKKKRKKKKKANSASTPSLPKKKVHFSNVIISEFHRDIHGDGVPLDGGFPLALSNKLHRTFHLPLDDFEHKKQVELKGRYEKYALARRKSLSKSNSKSKVDTKRKMSTKSGRRKRSNSKVADEMKVSSSEKSKVDVDVNVSKDPVYIPHTHTFETRQFDYKETQKDKRHYQEGTNGQEEWEEIFGSGRNILFGLLGESERKSLLFRDAHLDDQDGTSSSTAADASSSKKSSKRKDSISNDAYCALDVQHVRHELEQLRIHRTAENVAGCNCRKLHVVLPKDLNGGKKSKHHRRLTERRVKDELRRRHIVIPNNNAKREELEQLLHEEVEKHGCCYGNDCPCARSGIGCQSDTCSCWHMSHSSHKKESKFEDVSPTEAEQRCGNKNGIYVVDFDAIEKCRRHFICGSIAS